MRMIDEGIRSLLTIVANALPVASGHGLCIHNLSFFFKSSRSTVLSFKSGRQFKFEV